MTSAFSASFMKIAWPSLLLRLSVIAFLLRCRFWKSKPCRWPPIASVLPSEGGSILMTCAPQSASWRTAVGPARCAVRSRTEMWDRGRVVMDVSSSLGARHSSGAIFLWPSMTRDWSRARPALTSFESRLPLFHEGAAAFLEVFAVEAGFRHLLQLLVVLLGFRLGDLTRRGLGKRDGERGVLRDGAGDGAYHRVELGIGGHALDQAHVIGLLCRILLGGEQELHGPRQAHEARQPFDPQEPVAQPELGCRHAEARTFIAVAQVAAGREIHAAADAVAGDLGDGGLGEIVERFVAFLGDGVVTDLGVGIGAFALE